MAKDNALRPAPKHVATKLLELLRRMGSGLPQVGGSNFYRLYVGTWRTYGFAGGDLSQIGAWLSDARGDK